MSRSVPSDWYRHYFGHDYLRGAEESLPPGQTEREVAFVTGVLPLNPGARILDLCCGHGRHLVELAARGYAVTGLDWNRLFLNRARQALQERGLEAELVQADMRRIPPEPPYDAVINMFTAFGYLEDDAHDGRVMAAVHQALKPGGHFLLNVVNREWLLAHFYEHDWELRDNGTVVLMERRFNLDRGRLEVLETYLRRDGRREETGHSVRLYTLTEVRRMAAAEGLAVVETYGDFEGGAYTLESEWMTVLMRRE